MRARLEPAPKRERDKARGKRKNGRKKEDKSKKQRNVSKKIAKTATTTNHPAVSDD